MPTVALARLSHCDPRKVPRPLQVADSSSEKQEFRSGHAPLGALLALASHASESHSPPLRVSREEGHLPRAVLPVHRGPRPQPRCSESTLCPCSDPTSDCCHPPARAWWLCVSSNLPKLCDLGHVTRHLWAQYHLSRDPDNHSTHLTGLWSGAEWCTRPRGSPLLPPYGLSFE